MAAADFWQEQKCPEAGWRFCCFYTTGLTWFFKTKINLKKLVVKRQRLYLLSTMMLWWFIQTNAIVYKWISISQTIVSPVRQPNLLYLRLCVFFTSKQTQELWSLAMKQLLLAYIWLLEASCHFQNHCSVVAVIMGHWLLIIKRVCVCVCEAGLRSVAVSSVWSVSVCSPGGGESKAKRGPGSLSGWRKHSGVCEWGRVRVPHWHHAHRHSCLMVPQDRRRS